MGYKTCMKDLHATKPVTQLTVVLGSIIDNVPQQTHHIATTTIALTSYRHIKYHVVLVGMHANNSLDNIPSFSLAFSLSIISVLSSHSCATSLAVVLAFKARCCDVFAALFLSYYSLSPMIPEPME